MSGTITPQQAARRLGVCSHTLYRWIRAGRLKGAVRNLGTDDRPRYRLDRDRIETIRSEGFSQCASR